MGKRNRRVPDSSDKSQVSRMKSLYIKVTPDKYELPVAVSDTPDGLARLTGSTRATVLSCITHSRNGKHRSVYKRVFISDDD